jgi:transcriptional regulator with XRE-family HTH domain
VSERLKERREAAGLTLGQVSAYEGVTAQYLSQIETEKRNPNRVAAAGTVGAPLQNIC